MPTDMTLPCDGGMVNLRVGAIIMKDGCFLMSSNPRDPYLWDKGTVLLSRID